MSQGQAVSWPFAPKLRRHVLEEAYEADQNPETESGTGETALLREEALAKDWTREEKNEAWEQLQPDQ